MDIGQNFTNCNGLTQEVSMSKRDRIRGGEILYASHNLINSYFENALILITENNADGVFGVILNRPSRMPLREVFNISLDVPIEKRLFYSGGPVDEDMLVVLRLTESDSEDRKGKKILKDVELGGAWGSIENLVMTSEEEVRLFLGYAGWQEDQLWDELERERWLIYRGICSKEILTDWIEPAFEKRRDILKYLEEKDTGSS